MFEQELILLCCRSEQKKEHTERIQELLAKSLDWNLLLANVKYFRVLPLFFTNLVHPFRLYIPENIYQNFEKLYLQNCSFDLVLAKELLNVLALLDENGIQAVPFKGPVLAEEVFGDINFRVYNDLDVLIEKADLRKAVLLLRSHGFRFDIDLNLEQYLQLASNSFHANMINEKLSYAVELHWEMTGGCFSQTMELHDVNSRLRRIHFMDDEVWSLSSEDLLVYLCIHGNRHYWNNLDFISCVSGVVLKEKEMNWEHVIRIADKYGARRIVLLGCVLARDLLDVDLSKCLEEKIKELPSIDIMSKQVAKRLFEDEKDTMRYWDKVKFHNSTMDNFLNSLCINMKPIFHPTHSDWEWLTLPASSSSLYYILRPIRLGVKYTKKMFCR